MTEKTADAASKLVAGVTTAAIMMAVGGEQMLPSLITYAGPEIIAEEIADLVTPRVTAILNKAMNGDKEDMLIRPAIVAATVFGLFSVAVVGTRASLTIAGAAAGGCVAGSYVYKYLLFQNLSK